MNNRLEGLADSCIQRLENDGPEAIEAICAEHPDDAGELRRILSNLTRVGLIGGCAPTNEPPQELGDFRLIERLGQGGMGVVYDAVQKSLGRRVALKILRPGAVLHRGARERFEREIAAISKLDDPGICTVFDAGEVDGTPYLAMRRIEGETLEVKITNRRRECDTAPRGTTTSAGSWTREVVHWIEQIARAVHHAHEAGVVHRDLKPANVIIDPRGQPVVLDFGLARAIEDGADQLTMTGDRPGTPVYMAPEQVDPRFGSVDRHTDVYALGAILHECLALEPPFQAQSRAALFHSILTDAPALLRQPRFRHVGRELQVILEKHSRRIRDTAFRLPTSSRKSFAVSDSTSRFGAGAPPSRCGSRTGCVVTRCGQRCSWLSSPGCPCHSCFSAACRTRCARHAHVPWRGQPPRRQAGITILHSASPSRPSSWMRRRKTSRSCTEPLRCRRTGSASTSRPWQTTSRSRQTASASSPARGRPSSSGIWTHLNS